VFVGQTDPKYQFNVANTVTLFNGLFSVTANIAYQNGLTQQQGSIGYSADGVAVNGAFENLPNAPGASLGTQAAVVAAGHSLLSSQGSPIGILQTVNVLRFQSLSINYIPPRSVMQIFHVPSMSIALQGSNLGLHTNYRGLDPNVNAFSTAALGDNAQDTGQLPQPRTWQLSVRLGN
jgi:hypothetical protein